MRVLCDRMFWFRALITVCLLSRGWIVQQSYAQEATNHTVFEPRSPTSAIEESRRLVRTLMTDQHVPGLSVAVWCDGRVVWSEGFGYSDLETRVPVWPHTRFRIGSISKPLTAAAVGRLVERGKLDLDRPVREYVPYWPKKKHAITPRQLGGHLAGIRHYLQNEYLMSKEYPTVKSSIEIFGEDALMHVPGEKYQYSSYGFNLMSAVIEGASGEEFLSYVEREVFNTLQMRHTLADRPAEITENRTGFYVRQGDRIVNAPYVNNSYKWAGGGFLSTPEDLIRFAAAHLGEEFLKKETIQLLWTSQQTNAGEKTNYGIGWQTAIDDKGRLRVGHGGGSVGGTCKLVVYPSERVVVAITANMSNVRYGDLQYQVAESFMKAEQRLVTDLGEVE
jgi:serine beta-lactamase-like protein LACTB